jgi:SAM-dependent methyltransferase
MMTFDPEIYRNCNQDLAGLSDEECKAHFLDFGRHERRIFSHVRTAHERLSMRWLRGQGIEIGAGDLPTPLFGEATVVHADTDASLLFGGLSIDLEFSLDDPDLTPTAAFDFAIASHVLEHLDGLLIGLQNLIEMVRPKGIVYVSVPNREFDFDKYWLPEFPFEHHLEELSDKWAFKAHHDSLIVASFDTALHADSSRFPRVHDDVLLEELRMGRLSEARRFAFHKHSYDFHGWASLFFRAASVIEPRFRVVDAAFGIERHDCNFVLERL